MALQCIVYVYTYRYSCGTWVPLLQSTARILTLNHSRCTAILATAAIYITGVGLYICIRLILCTSAAGSCCTHTIYTHI